MSNYFKQVPDFDYVSRLTNAKISDYITVKNLFKRGKLADDIFPNLSFFTKYQIEGDDRPDNVAYKVYNDATVDWVVLLSNNYTNIQSEWPMLQNDFDRYLLDKYGTYEKLNDAHHYETTEIKNEDGERTGGVFGKDASLMKQLLVGTGGFLWFLNKFGPAGSVGKVFELGIKGISKSFGLLICVYNFMQLQIFS